MGGYIILYIHLLLNVLEILSFLLIKTGSCDLILYNC